MKVFLLKYIATWLAENNKLAINAIIEAIRLADARYGKGSDKLTYVRSKAVEYLSGKAGWIVDTVIHLLLAWTRKS
jgi:hypothetical protein